MFNKLSGALWRALSAASVAAGLMVTPQIASAGDNVFARTLPWVITRDGPGMCHADLIDVTKPDRGGRMLRFQVINGSLSIVTDGLMDATTIPAQIDDRTYDLFFQRSPQGIAALVGMDVEEAIRNGFSLDLRFAEDMLPYTLGGSASMLDLLWQCAWGKPARTDDLPQDWWDWVTLSNGAIDPRSPRAGFDLNVGFLHVCTVDHNGGTHPGKVSWDLKGCFFGYGGQEWKNPTYRMIIGKQRWLPALFNSIPDTAMAIGNEADGTPLYACRTEYKGGWQLGKTRPGFNGCNFGYGGQELTGSPFQVLIY